VLQKDKLQTLERLQLNLETVQAHAKKLATDAAFKDRLLEALVIMDAARGPYSDAGNVDGQLYDGFLGGSDNNLMPKLCAADPAEIAAYADKFHDKRMQKMVPLYKARNFPDSLTSEERAIWDKHCYERLLGGGQGSALAKYFDRLGELAASADESKRFILEELQLYGQAIMPIVED
jgi:exodeoxyribonuclease-1